MYFVLFATLLFLQPVFPQECRQVTVCNETPREMIKGDKGDTGNAGKAGPEGKRGETGSKGIKGERGLQGESCALGSLGTNIINKLAELETLLTPAFCRLSSVNGRQTLRSGEEVVCDNGWRMIQRNFDTDNLNFDETWVKYKQGFGNLSKDFWLGLDNIHEITSNRSCKLRVDLWGRSGDHKNAEYRLSILTFSCQQKKKRTAILGHVNQLNVAFEEPVVDLKSDFHVEDENNGYRLHVTGYKGTVRDSLAYHDNMRFTTKDRDYDSRSGNCAVSYRSGWWYKSCVNSALNGNSVHPYWSGFSSARKATMKVRCD